ncbi:MAG: hypothetical protein AAFQ58_12075 [Pseudomonadota bacterium]
MKGRKNNFLRVTKQGSEARGRLEVVSLLILGIVNSRALLATILVVAAAYGVLETDLLDAIVGALGLGTNSN